MKAYNCLSYSLLSIILFLFSCTERISLELDNSLIRLAVYGEITTDRKVHKIRLTRTSYYFDNKPAPGISGALVSISDGTNAITLTENYLIPGTYETAPNFAGIIGKTYYLSIENVDVDEDGKSESYSALSYLPPVAHIDSIRLSYLSNTFISGWQVHLFVLDPANRKDFYSFKIYKNEILQTDSLSEYIFQNDEFFNGNYTNGIITQFLNDSKSNEKAIQGDRITFELNGITQEYFNFLTQAQAEIFLNTPLFSGPPANIKSNISNNAVGFFTAYSISKSSAIIPEL